MLLPALLLIAASADAHVPLYCGSACCTPHHDHTVSQAVYIRGSGGFSIPKSKIPASHTLIDYDVVMKKNYDPSTYSLHIGCGQCGVSAPRVTQLLYKDPVIEPFTQTPIYGLFKGVDRPQFKTRHLKSCPYPQFTIWIADFNNRTDGNPLIWSAVVGHSEQFTAGELFLFPVFILNNHGWYWNQMWFTYPVILVFLFPASAFLVWNHPFRWSVADLRGVRERLYAAATFFFAASILEIIVHLFVAAHGASFIGFGIGLGAVVAVGNLFPLSITLISWSSMYHPTWIISHKWWWLLELLSGFSYFFLFGSGLWMSPLFVILASIVRAATPSPTQFDIVSAGQALL